MSTQRNKELYLAPRSLISIVYTSSSGKDLTVTDMIIWKSRSKKKSPAVKCKMSCTSRPVEQEAAKLLTVWQTDRPNSDDYVHRIYTTLFCELDV